MNRVVRHITDSLQSTRTESYSYDALNRLAQMNTGTLPGSAALKWEYDIWGNRTRQEIVGVNTQTWGYAANNRINESGFTFDAAGNMTAHSGGATFQWDAENRMKSLNTTGATYTYDANGMRVRKQSASETTEYIYFGAQVIAERDSANGDWSDYIYAGGRRLAKADSFEDRIRVWGTRCGGGCGYAFSDYHFPSAAGHSGYVMRSGDKLYLRQWQTGASRGGIYLGFTDSTYAAWNAWDQDGQVINSDSYSNQWHHRRVDLSAFAGKTLNLIALRIEGDTPAGFGEIYYQDIALVSADGSVRTIYNRQKIMALNIGGSGFTSQGYEVHHLSSGVGPYPQVSTVFYHGDHLGSSRQITAYEGYPVWEATYRPFGESTSPSPPAPSHYLFTGFERDAESALDHTWFRQYSSAQARWLSPDPLDGTLSDPQSLNRYAYVLNSPTSLVDPLGLSADDFTIVQILPSGSWIAGGGGGGGGCTLNGVDFPCDVLQRGWSSGAFYVCPGGDCSGVTVRGGTVYQTALVSTWNLRNSFICLDPVNRVRDCLHTTGGELTWGFGLIPAGSSGDFAAPWMAMALRGPGSPNWLPQKQFERFNAKPKPVATSPPNPNRPPIVITPPVVQKPDPWWIRLLEVIGGALSNRISVPMFVNPCPVGVPDMQYRCPPIA